MATVHKVTVSLPDQLVAQIEKLRQRTSGTRSGIITELLWRGWHDVEQEEREARYRAAYAAMPDDAEGTAFIDAASADFFEDADTWPAPETDPPRKAHEER
jgi:metal-responsive CopG/Arc/MetJ family transcriptional regulator